MVKVQCKNRYEVQIDTETAEILHVAFRRSDLIESIHDGSYFNDHFKLWVFTRIGAKEPNHEPPSIHHIGCYGKQPSRRRI